jgi:hypothetical protein
MSEIHAYKGEKLNALDIKITRYLMFQIREEGRRQTRLHGIPFIITAHELLGVCTAKFRPPIPESRGHCFH